MCVQLIHRLSGQTTQWPDADHRDISDVTVIFHGSFRSLRRNRLVTPDWSSRAGGQLNVFKTLTWRNSFIYDSDHTLRRYANNLERKNLRNNALQSYILAMLVINCSEISPICPSFIACFTLSLFSIFFLSPTSLVPFYYIPLLPFHSFLRWIYLAGYVCCFLNYALGFCQFCCSNCNGGIRTLYLRITHV